MSGSGNASLAAHRDALFTLAEASIDHGLSYGLPRLPDGETVPEALQRERSAFVTLFHAGELRGCIGSLEPRRALAEEVAANAFAAAFRDPRFPPLTEQERPGLSLKIEVLGPAEPIEFRDEAELLARLRPGEDGVVLEAVGRSATFLPTVWEQLSEPAAFWETLKRKAGLPPGFFDPGMRVYRYTTELLA